MEAQTDKPVEYDEFGHMLYHPDYHTKHGTHWSEEDLEYLCKYGDFDRLQDISLALERTFRTVAEMKKKLRAKGLYNYYKTLNKHW